MSTKRSPSTAVPVSTTSTRANPNSACQRVTKHECVADFDVDSLILPQPYLKPELNYLNKTAIAKGEPSKYTLESLLKQTHLDNPIVIFGEPYCGKTCLMIKLAHESKRKMREHWVRFLDLSELVPFSKTKFPKSFVDLCATYLNVSEKSIKDKFKALPRAKEILRNNGNHTKLVRGDMFLEGLDEMPPEDREIFLRLLPQMVNKRVDCPIRIWLSCRSYFKPRMMNILGGGSSFEIVKYTQEQQLDLMYCRWKAGNSVPDEKNEKVKQFANMVYSSLETQIKDFCDTLGGIPFIMHTIAGIFTNAAHYFVNPEVPVPSKHKGPRHTLYSGLPVPELVESICRSVVECYCLKIGKTIQTKAVIQKEYQRIVKIHCKFAVQTYPKYEYELKQPSNSRRDKEDMITMKDELFRVGFITLDDRGVVKFHNKMLGDFFIGKHFSFPDALETRDPLLDRFYLRSLLFENEAKEARMYYDALLYTVYVNRPVILRDFLMSHYKLGVGDEDEWDWIRNDGTIWHQAIMEGFHRVAQVILDGFNEDDMIPLRTFLSITAPFDIYKGNPPEKYESTKEHHDLSSLSVLALFGYGLGLRDFLDTFLCVFTTAEIEAEFNTQGEWTPMHYAAIHSNLWFIGEVFNTPKIRLEPGIFNTKGQVPLHLLMTYSWFHRFTLRDTYSLEYDKHAFKGQRQRYVKQRRIVDTRREIETTLEMVKSMSRPMRDTQHGCIDYLLKGKENVNIRDKHTGMTVLHFAARDGQLETVRKLVHLGATVGALDLAAGTPLHLAALNGHRSVFLYLVKNKARPTVKDLSGLSPIAIWKRYGEKLDKDGEMSEREKIFFKACEDVEKLHGDELEGEDSHSNKGYDEGEDSSSSSYDSNDEEESYESDDEEEEEDGKGEKVLENDDESNDDAESL